MSLRKVRLDVQVANASAIKTYERVGFKREGVLRQEVFRQGPRARRPAHGAARHRNLLSPWPLPSTASGPVARAGTVEEVAGVLSDVRELGRWWPAVYLKVDELSAGEENGVGKRARLHTKGWLPYTLDWELTVVESRHPRGFTIEAQGDLAGRGVWRLEPAGAWTRVTYDWVVRAEKPLLRALSPLLRPLLAANHRWAMRRGEESLALELARRRAASRPSGRGSRLRRSPQARRRWWPSGPARRSGWPRMGWSGWSFRAGAGAALAGRRGGACGRPQSATVS